ncbi:proteasome assembly chaperone family protein [Candidatus Woesearchaeota archaeon]|nr:proteasome assembly chaperone family protein [Candidatus Woesearchaeota archaeon]
MKVELFKDIQSPLILEGFPGFGLVSTITIEYLINHLNTELVGRVHSNKLPPMVAVHEGKVIEPIGIFYNKDFNLIFVYSMLNPKGLEWEVTEAIVEISNRTNAIGIISLEGISKVTETGDQAFMFCVTKETEDKLAEQGLKPLRDGIIMGVTSTLLTRSEKPVDCIFVETNPEIPDSLGAARLVTILDKLIGFNIDTKPLVETAKIFEEKIKKVLENSKAVASQNKGEDFNYVG